MPASPGSPHGIQLKGPYDIAVEPARENDGSYGLTTDWWDGHVVKEVGIGYGRLLQSYGVHKTIREARSRGLRTHRRQEVSWSVLIRAPLARGDVVARALLQDVGGFNPRPSCEGRRPRFGRRHTVIPVSIRAPLARGDPPPLLSMLFATRFNPRPSCEGRQACRNNGLHVKMFQSAPLLRGATFHFFGWLVVVGVSIRAPLARGDLGFPRRSRRRRVSIRAPLARGDKIKFAIGKRGVVSIRAPLARGDTARPRLCPPV